MPIVTNFIYCEQAEINPSNQKLNLSAPLNFINPGFIPGMFSFTVVFGIIGLNVKQHNELQLVILNSSEEEVTRTDILTIPAQSGKEAELPFEMQGFVAHLEFRNLIFRSEGVHTTQVYVNGDMLGEYRILVKGVEPK